jgi:hypothetical protein
MLDSMSPARLAVLLAPLLAAQAPDFARDIQPVLAKSCLACHGPSQQLGNLRLDSKASAARVLKPGDSSASPLYQRVSGSSDQARMPMGAAPLDPATTGLIKRWIDSGANWPDAASTAAGVAKHWAFQPPTRPAAPASKSKWPANPIDRFVLARLDKEGLAPSPEADKVTLLRRLSLDLVGLPPTPAEVDAFLRDKSAKAYSKQVERLLASEHYGERWGRHWLDAARYADSDGFEKDKPRWVWFYRDWVIRALNRDLPYNQFLTEQLAGDLLPNATQDQRVATGFLRNSMINEEGGIDPEQFRMEAMFDRMDAIGKAMLGITIQCAQCHNHKYDPIAQEEYYRLFAYLNNSHESNIAVYTPEQQAKRADLFRRMREIEADVQHRNPDWRERMARWEAEVRANQPVWEVVTPSVDDISTGGQKYLPQPDGSFLAAGYAPTKHRAKFVTKTRLRRITGFRLELLNDANLPMGGPGRSIQGTGALTEFDAEVADHEGEKGTKVKIASASADVNPPEAEIPAIYFDKTNKRRVTGPVGYAIDGKEETAWGVDIGPHRRNLPRNAVFVAEKPVELADGGTVVFYLSQRHGGWNSDDNQNHNLGRMRLSVTSSADPKADTLPRAVREIVDNVPSDKRSPEQTQAVFAHFLTTVPEWRNDADRVESLWREHPEPTLQLVLNEREAARTTSILMRGDFLKPTRAVPPGTPAFLNPMSRETAALPPNRLALARWMTQRDSPTVARTLVNRVWQAYFGTGLFATSEDIGRQSEPPSHPELLDWLAVEFMDKGWSMKNLHRTIVHSATYRQSSRSTPEMQSKDPYNRLLARGPRIRVEAEIVRDIALSASGLLNPKVGGPSVHPPAPDFLFQPPTSYGPKVWKEETGADRYRRALYTFRYRSVPYPMLQNFDAPNGDFACVRRPRSNTPLQALTTLNEPLFLETARALAHKALAEGGATDASRLAFAFRRCVSRAPSTQEVDELLTLLAKQAERYSRPGANPWDLAAEDPTKPPSLPPGATPAQAAAWTVVSRVLLNLDETITKE